MNSIPTLWTSALALALAASPFSLAHAQTGMVPVANPDADRLAQDMRLLAANPQDVSALLDAGAASIRLNDLSAALAFFQRAERAEPGNPRILSGRGSVLVRMERPGEALTLFQTAEARGVPAREFAADRGFAYDLLGQPGLAQKDYRVALEQSRDDETVRRYALSLGSSGRSEEAMAALDPLLRRSDRAAWRARAFILAMNGDLAGADRIAASMMPGAMGQALTPFFRRLAVLPQPDRAFAVHFGELSPTPARLADARMAPALPRYVPEAAPVQLAKAAPAPAIGGARDRRGASRRTARSSTSREPAASPVRIAQAPAKAAAVPMVQPTPPAGAAAVASMPVQRAATPMVQPTPSAPVVRTATASPQPRPATPMVQPTPPASPVQLAAAEPAPRAASAATPSTPATADVAAPIVTPPASAPSASTPTQLAAREETPPAVSSAGTAASPPSQSVTLASAAAPIPPGPAKVGQEDAVLAAIVANITIPAEELEVLNAPAPVRIEAPAKAEPQPAAPAPAPAKVAAAPARPKPQPAPIKEPAKSAEAKTAAARDAKGKPDSKAVKEDPKAKKADTKAKKPEPKAKADPARIWVQVASGANEDTLSKAWKGVVAKSPTSFKGRSGWQLPFKATNRVVTGPFKTAAEAQAFVNTLSKNKLSGFVVNSEAGEKVTRLDP